MSRGDLFDIDGVLADVSASYRATIVATAAEFGVRVSQDDIEAVKRAGDANNDWVVTQRLLMQRESMRRSRRSKLRSSSALGHV